MRSVRADTGRYEVKDWSQTQGSLFQAVKMEKMMVSFAIVCGAR